MSFLPAIYKINFYFRRLLPMFAFTLLATTLIMPSEANGKSPNIIYILADDLGYGDLSCYGQDKISTPNIDRLAKEGMRFTQHYSGSTVCAPSRCSLLTGKHIGHAVVRGNSEVLPEGQHPMPANTYTLAQQFQKADYKTGLFGKWGLGFPGSVSEPMKMGFDRFYGYNCQRLAHHYFPYFLWNDNKRDILWDNFGKQRQQYAPDRIQEEVLQFVEQNKEQPFFCFYAMIQPHAEMFAPEDYMTKYRGKFLPESTYEGTDAGPNYRKFAYGSQDESHAAFAAMLSVMDDDVGELMSKLEVLGIAEDTLVIFTSDNGPHREGGHDPDYFNSSGSLRGTKRDLYEGGIRVPMIAHWPGKILAGSETDHVSAFWDVFPTVSDLIGIPTPKDCDGISFLPTMLGKPNQEQHEYLYWEFHELRGRLAIRCGNWKGVRYNVANDPNSQLELYDLASDVNESNNVASQYPEIVQQLNAMAMNARTISPDQNSNFPLKREVSESGLAHEKK